MVVEPPSRPRTQALAWIIGAAACVLPVALISYGYPQWIFFVAQGACFGVGREAWYIIGRAAGGLGTLAIVGLAVFGMAKGGAARIAGAVTISLGVVLFFVVGFTSYFLFRVALEPCG
jgi:hypothetical protein